MTTTDDLLREEPIFVVRTLKYGTYEVVAREAEMPARHISDFRSEDEAQAWIRESGPDWVKKHPRTP